MDDIQVVSRKEERKADDVVYLCTRRLSEESGVSMGGNGFE